MLAKKSGRVGANGEDSTADMQTHQPCIYRAADSMCTHSRTSGDTSSIG